MYRLLALLLLSAFALAQTKAPAQKPAQPPTKPPSAPASAAPATAPKTAEPAEVAPTAPVITIAGLCNGRVPATPSPECKTVITRAEFEKLANALDPKEVHVGFDRDAVVEVAGAGEDAVPAPRVEACLSLHCRTTPSQPAAG